MAMCPNGHQSGTDDWCEICGMRMPLPGAGAEQRPSSPGSASSHGSPGYEPRAMSSGPSGYEPHATPPASPGYEFRPSSSGPSGYGPRPSSSASPGPSPASAPSSAFPSSPSSAPPASAPPFPGRGGPGASGGAYRYPGDPTAAAELCPQCGTPREGTELFCEECRYNFRTHTPTVAPGGYPPGPRAQHPPAPPPGLSTAPRPPAPGPGPLSSGPAFGGPLSGGRPGSGGPMSGGGPVSTPHAPEQPPYQRHESQRSRPSQVNRPAEPVPSESVTSGSGDFLLNPPSRPVPAGPQERPEAAGSLFARPPGRSGPASAPPPPPPSRGTAPGSGPGPAAGAPRQPTEWVAVVAADRAYFAAMMSRSGPEAQGLYFPAFSPELRLPLSGPRITIGRRRHSTGEAPDIDLSRSPEDPGVSHQHAALVRRPDGGWSVVDQGSTNGTTVNLAEEPVQPHTPVPLDEGDQVHVGAWTTITIRRA